MYFKLPLLGFEFFAELNDGPAVWDVCVRQPKTLELWLGRLYVTMTLA